MDGSDLVYYENDEMATVTATGMLNLGKGTVEYGAAVAESLMGTGCVQHFLHQVLELAHLNTGTQALPCTRHLRWGGGWEAR